MTAVSAVMACPVRVTGSLRRVLIRRARGQTTPYRDKVRAQIVLRAAERQPNAQIAAALAVTVDTVRTWRGRFAEHGLAGLRDRPRSGRPSRFSAVQRAQVTALACQAPTAAGAPLARWSCPELARQVMDQGIAEAISPATVRRWLAREAIKPWQVVVVSPGPGFRGQGRAGAGPLRGSLGGPQARAAGVRDLQ